MEYGKLYLVPTPIGNLKDITLRALEVLENVDTIAAEDTRQSLKLLNHYKIKKTLISYHKFNENTKSNEIIERLRAGENIAVITDAGTPGISDPGSTLVRKCIDNDIAFEVLPGATAITTALVYSGLDTSKFIFYGFIPRDNKSKEEITANLTSRIETIIFYEAPHRLLETLTFLRKGFGNRNISICRELTKLHEEIMRGSLDEIIKYYDENSPKGEYVLVLEGKSKEEILSEARSVWNDISIEDHIKKYIGEGFSKKEAVKMVAKDRNMKKSEIYNYSIDL
ncbi:16S rRNA (cytidine(1402)-2'-O)-methyltransferase [Clostridium oryzae]|uniref:Ribosomal RNA small subunit methyltransferase I n=1 Tax=Clostridium oryzae TaxID=1450648 RepID=A0A1V4IP96_9CLOT|nr:16S rRNA (cytidine(1402)-2'-O)-methyltransferase [Clostridium oryzae]OPJ61277.1 ribosomal RNA small subunit methyltransferase I [Clostridium oryzae]